MDEEDINVRTRDYLASHSEAQSFYEYCKTGGGDKSLKRAFDIVRSSPESIDYRAVFVPAMDSLFSGSRESLEQWETFARCCAFGVSVRDTAERCGVSAKTAVEMRKRLEFYRAIRAG